MRTLLVVGLSLIVSIASAEPKVVVGSKAFTESVILADLAAQLARTAGADATHRRELGGTRVVWEALLRGEIDLYPEYTGTLAQEIFAKEHPTSEADLRSLLASHGLQMSEPLGFEDTYAIGMREAEAQRLGVHDLSDLSHHPELRFGLSNEFMNRADGWPLLRSRYGLASAIVSGLDHQLAYRALSSGSIDVTDLYSTDAEIQSEHLRILTDDQHVFPDYRAVFVYRAELESRAPAALTSILRLQGHIARADMIAMNAQARIEHRPEAQVAAEFLRTKFGLQPNPNTDPDRWTTRLRVRTEEHLFLVIVSLLAALLVGVPLGILAQRRARLGRAVLAVTGIVQTIPSLALLVFMLPLFGVGAKPAIAALFLYGLLPIVRNTYAGLTGLSPELRDSAAALGLPSFARLRLIELPLALPSILAGVQTSAVITVGTATIGALIGAGGYGQPILTGIRLADTSLILEGAVPAAVLALAIEGLFDLLGSWLLPPPLRRVRRAGA